MKKLLTIVLALVLVLGLFAGCGAKADNELVMATNAAFPPYEYKDGDKIVGIDAEIAAAIAEKLGMTLVIEDVDFGAVLTGVAEGKYDMGMAGITVTDERKETMDFSDTYATGIQVIIVNDGSEIESLDDLFEFNEDGDPVALKNPDIKVGVQENTTGDIYSTVAGKQYTEVYYGVHFCYDYKHGAKNAFSADDAAAGMVIAPSFVDTGALIINADNVEKFVGFSYANR